MNNYKIGINILYLFCEYLGYQCTTYLYILVVRFPYDQHREQLGIGYHPSEITQRTWMCIYIITFIVGRLIRYVYYLVKNSVLSSI
jgi:hypothetical protein